MQKGIQPPACSVHGLHRTLFSYWLAHWKNPPKCSSILVRVAEWWIFYLRAEIQRTIDVSPAFMEYGLMKKIAAWAHATREPNKQEDWRPFCMERLRNLNSYQIFKIKNKKLKTYSDWCPFKGLSNDTTLMLIQSGRTVPLRKVISLKIINA
jgi:hypothetical protein